MDSTVQLREIVETAVYNRRRKYRKGVTAELLQSVIDDVVERASTELVSRAAYAGSVPRIWIADHRRPMIDVLCEALMEAERKHELGRQWHGPERMPLKHVGWAGLTRGA